LYREGGEYDSGAVDNRFHPLKGLSKEKTLPLRSV
jgi:hypothetical protein